jgi:hypothetical protein
MCAGLDQADVFHADALQLAGEVSAARRTSSRCARKGQCCVEMDGMRRRAGFSSSRKPGLILAGVFDGGGRHFGNFLPRRKLQPIVLGHGGYMYSTQPIPTTDAGSFNFTFDFGVGFELYRTRTRSIRVDYRYHHISDHYTTTENPGIDNGLFTVAYSFGR